MGYNENSTCLYIWCPLIPVFSFSEESKSFNRVIMTLTFVFIFMSGRRSLCAALLHVVTWVLPKGSVNHCERRELFLLVCRLLSTVACHLIGFMQSWWGQGSCATRGNLSLSWTDVDWAQLSERSVFSYSMNLKHILQFITYKQKHIKDFKTINY